MPLIQCTEQSRESFEKFYTEFVPKDSDNFADVGTPMLNVLKLINDTFKETIIYGLTSHATLLLLNKDGSLNPWHIALKGITASSKSLRIDYYIEYKMTENKRPWPEAIIQGSTTSLDELKKYLIIAMTETNGWTDSQELKKLYQTIQN